MESGIAASRLGQLSAFAGGISKDAFGQELWQRSVDASLDLRFIQQFARSPLMSFLHEPVPPSFLDVGDDSADLHFRPHALPAGWRHALRWAHFGSISLSAWPPVWQAVWLLAVDPSALGGLVLRGGAGPQRDTVLAGLRAALPAGTPWRRLPVRVDEQRLSGGLDLGLSLAAGRPVMTAGL
ncbi:hypothetical protein FKK32_29540, partial [Klebsiella pneumoniae]|nr:hypothetical protein [Klebsiella pneumoniae]